MSGLEILLIGKAIAFFKAHAAVAAVHQAATVGAAHVAPAVAHNAAIHVAQTGVQTAAAAPTATQAAATLGATGMFAYGIASQEGGMVGAAQRRMGRYGVGNPRPSTVEEEEEIVRKPERVQTKTSRVTGDVEEEIVTEPVWLRTKRSRAAEKIEEEIVREPPPVQTETRRAGEDNKGKIMRGPAPTETGTTTGTKQTANSFRSVPIRKPVPRLYDLEKEKAHHTVPTSGRPQPCSENERGRAEKPAGHWIWVEDVESTTVDPAIHRGFRSSRMQRWYLGLRAVQFCFAVALLVLTCLIIQTGLKATPPPSIQFFLFEALFTLLYTGWSGGGALKKTFVIPIHLIVVETMVLIFTFSASVTIAVGFWWNACYNQESLGDDVLGFTKWPWGTIWSGYSESYVSGLLWNRCNEEETSCVFFWLSLPLYVGTLAILLLSYRHAKNAAR